MLSLFFFLLSLLLAHTAVANTEKVIFTGPSRLPVPIEHPTLEDLRLHALSPQQWSVRTHLSAEFPANASTGGKSSWLLLRGLEEGQRYEVRICWAATEPTSFRLDTYELPTVFETPELITSLAEYSASRQPGPVELEDQEPSISTPQQQSKHTYDDVSSALFLQIQAAADYYTTNQTLMNNVPPVFVDIILDPYIGNVLPRSLVPTVAYITLLAIGSWYLSKYISRWVQSLARDDMESRSKSKTI